MDLLDETLLNKITESAGLRLCKGFGSINVGVRHIHNRTDYQIDHRYNHTWICLMNIYLFTNAAFIFLAAIWNSSPIFSSIFANQSRRGKETKIRKNSNSKLFQRQNILGLNLLHRPKIIASPINYENFRL